MARSKTGRTVVAKNLTLRPVDWATIDAHAKHAGLLTRSAGLRSILAEWRQLKADYEGELAMAASR